MRSGIRVLVVVAVLMLTAAGAPSAHAQVPDQMSYQGALILANGSVVSDGVYQIAFKIFDAAAIGNLLFSQTLSVKVVQGLYSVVLSSSIIPSTSLLTAISTPPVYLEVTIESGGSFATSQTLSPRQLLTSVPYALMSGSAPATSGVPAGAIILWDQSSSCPPNYTEAAEFQNLTIRGADTGASDVAIPDVAGETCPGGTGCDAADVAAYDDILDESEMPAHTHDVIGRGGGGSYSTAKVYVLDYHNSNSDTAITESTGKDGPHYHPFRTVLFCRKN